MHEAADAGLQRLARECLGTRHVHPAEDFRRLAGREGVGDLRTGMEDAHDPFTEAAQRSGLGEIAGRDLQPADVVAEQLTRALGLAHEQAHLDARLREQPAHEVLSDEAGQRP